MKKVKTICDRCKKEVDISYELRCQQENGLRMYCGGRGENFLDLDLCKDCFKELKGWVADD